MSCLALVTDLIFATKIRSTGAAVGCSVVPVGSDEAFRQALDAHRPALVVVDVTCGGPLSEKAIAAAKAHAARPYIVAYGPHVEHEALETAAACGADLVLPRSKFSEQLPELLKKHASGAAAT